MALFLTLMLSGGGPVDEGFALEGLLADAAGAAAPGCDSAAMLLCPVAAIRSASASPPLLVWGRALRVGHALFDGTPGFSWGGPAAEAAPPHCHAQRHLVDELEGGGGHGGCGG